MHFIHLVMPLLLGLFEFSTVLIINVIAFPLFLLVLSALGALVLVGLPLLERLEYMLVVVSTVSCRWLSFA